MSTPALLGCAVAALALGLPVVSGAVALEVRHRVAHAADSAALAAADAVGGFVEHDPCALATMVAEANTATLTSCEISTLDGVVRVAVSAPTAWGIVRGDARAGPAGVE